MVDKEKIIIEVEESNADRQSLEKNTRRVLVFSLGGENYSFDISQIKEVVRLKQITKVPNVPGFIVGIMNLRGEIISILDIRSFFGLNNKEKTGDMRVIITDVTQEAIGIMVDKVLGTIDIAEDEIQPPLATLRSDLAGYTCGQVEIENEILTLLDLEKILKTDDIEKLRKGKT